MHRALTISALFLTALLAGCAQKDPAAQPAPAAADTQYADSVVQVSAPIMPRDPPAAGERTLEAAPQWRLGEWWTYRMVDGFTGQTHEFTRVVAGEDRAAGNYLVGFPLETFSNDVLLYHVPGYGDIVQSSLAYETHDSYFKPLDFPLVEGKSWEVSFEGVANGLAEVVSAADGKARIEMAVSAYGSIIAEYDAATGEIVSMDIGNGSYAAYTIVDHGYNYQGVVRVPHAHDLVFIHGRLAGAVVVGNSGGLVGPVGGVTESVIVEPGYDRVGFIIAVGGGTLTGLPATAGAFRETVTAPDSTVYEVTWTPADIPTAGMLKIEAFGHDSPEGTWNLQHLAGGGGVAFVEGIGYHSIDVDLPSGCVIASFNAQHHNADCKVGNAGNSTVPA